MKRKLTLQKLFVEPLANIFSLKRLQISLSSLNFGTHFNYDCSYARPFETFHLVFKLIRQANTHQSQFHVDSNVENSF